MSMSIVGFELMTSLSKGTLLYNPSTNKAEGLTSFTVNPFDGGKKLILL